MNGKLKSFGGGRMTEKDRRVVRQKWLASLRKAHSKR